MMKHLLFTFASLALGGAVSAQEQEDGSYDLTDTDRVAMTDAGFHYNICLREQTDKLFNLHPDIRELTDAAMQACEPILLTIDEKLETSGLAEDFRFGYIRHTKNTSVRRLLPELMARKASAPAPAAEASPPQSTE